MFISLGGFSFMAKAQQDAQFSQFYANKLFYNPAGMIGDKLFRVSLTDREQWWGSAGRPSYRTLNVSQFFPDQHMGIGLTVYQWNQNIENNILAKLAYSYHLQVGQEAFLSFGLSVGVIDRFISGVVTPGGEYGGSITGELNDFNPNLDLGFGLEFYTKELVAGVSVEHVPIRLGPNPSRLALHSYYYFGYNFRLTNNWSLFPLLVLRNGDGKTNVDINLRAFYRDIVNFGASYRIDAVALMAGVNLGKNFGLSYSYDINLGPTAQFKPSHELILSFRGCLLCKKKDQPLIFFE